MTTFSCRENPAVCAWRDLSVRNRIRSADRRRLDDGSDRGARLRRLSGRYQGLWPLDPAAGNERSRRKPTSRSSRPKSPCATSARRSITSCKRRGVAKINLMGWSWGTAIAGQIHQREQRQGGPPRAVRAAVDLSQRRRDCAGTGGFRQRRAAARRLPAGLERSRKSALAGGRARRQAGRSHSARRVRGLDRGDLGDRSGCGKAQSADVARAERRDRRRACVLDRRQGVLRSRQDHRADLPHSRRMGFRSAELSGAGSISRS